jgi:hypothetical protein
VTFCEFGTLIGIIGDVQVSIDFFVKGDARLGLWLSECLIFRGKCPSV